MTIDMTRARKLLPSSEVQNQVWIDPVETLRCAEACIATYKDHADQPFDPPTGYEFVARFTGWDQILIVTGSVERYGLVFRSIADPKTVLVAFRGTGTLLEWYEDIWTWTSAFKPLDANDFPSDVWICSGFNNIYSDFGGSMTASMQQQVFDIIDDLDPDRVIVTGHSLGGALASMFRLDLAASRPGIDGRATTIASPKVGKYRWYETYEIAYGLLGSSIRIYNDYDLVPSLPPGWMGFYHVGQPFAVSFWVTDAWLKYYASKHSMDNYATVLGHAVDEPDQMWEGSFTDAISGYPMTSAKPVTSVDPSTIGRLVQERPDSDLARVV